MTTLTTNTQTAESAGAPPEEVRARLWGRLAAAGPLAALAATVYAHLLPGTGISPLTGLVSDYALTAEGRGTIMAGALMLAMGCLWSVYGMAQADPGRTAATRFLLTAAALGLAMTAIFPVDPAAGAASLGGELHHWSAALVFTGIPCAAWMLCRDRPAHPHWRLLRGTALASVVLLAAFLAAHPASLVSDLIAGGSYHGLLQRLLLLSDIALLFLTATAIPLTARTSRSPVRLRRLA